MVLRTLSGDSPDAAAAQRRVFDALPAAVFTCDARARLTYVNPVWRDLLGYPEDVLLSMSYHELMDAPTVEAWNAAVARVVAGAPGFAIEKRLRHQDGSVRWIQCNVNAVRDARGRLRGLIGVGMDIGKRKRGELLQAGLRDVLEDMARGAPLQRVLLGLATVIEDALDYGARAAILLAQPDGTLGCAAAPSLAPDFLAATTAVPIGEGYGSCAAAASRREPVFVHDVTTDPDWEHVRALAAAHGIGAGWSVPILSSRGALLGTFAVYYRAPRSPTAAERTMLEIASRSATVALERVHAEAALRERGEQFRRTIENAPIPVLLHAEDGQVLQLSRTWTRLTGYTLHDRDALRALLARAYRAGDEEGLAGAVRRLFAGGGSLLQRELDVTTRDGARLVWNLSAAAPGTLRDGRRYVVVMALDITGRKQAEERLRASEERASLATRVAQVGIWSYEPDGGVFEADARCREICGLPPSGPLTLDDWMTSIHPDDRGQAGEALRAALDPEGDGQYHMEMRQLHPDGQVRWIVERAQCLFTGEGEARRPLQLLGSMLDFTDSRRMQESLVAADRRKDEFIATLAHELRNPLAPMRNCLHVLRLREDGDPQVTRLHAMMERQVGLMVRLVDDLLEVSRITRGNIDLRKRAVPLAEVIATAVETSRPHIDQGRHRLEVDLPPTTVMLDADPMRLAQVFTNLLNNAAKYTPPGGRIVIKTRTHADSVEVSVCDTGIGLPAEMLVQVFDLFAQCEHTRTHAQGGLGIGLTLVRSLVEQHGGSVEAHSDGLGKGSEFVVRLPLLARAGVAADAVPEREPPAHRAQSVLVADDNHESADSMALFLRMSGHDVRTVYDGRACLEAIEERRPDVVLLDIGMPLLDGYETCRLIRALPGGRDIAVLATTGWGQDADRERSTACGFDAHLVKPVDPGALLARLDALRAAHPPGSAGGAGNRA
ncbi:MAG TPA: PAS domain S-box protein [Xanthomonadaceae bacterium]|nr:PAS domain S-box protein [Xanthomonadaceae bacterium]